jgi:hypothetical protein
MARIVMAGAEIEAASATSSGPEGTSTGTGLITRDTSIFRGGVASWKFNTGGSSQSIIKSFTVTSNATLYIRVYVYATAAPGGTRPIISADFLGASTMGVQFRTDGGLQLLSAGAAQGSPTASIADSKWHKVELFCAYASTFWTDSELRVDDATIATWTGTVGATTGTLELGWDAVSLTANDIIYMDDLAVNDTSGTVNNSWCGDGIVDLMKPTSDSQRGSWTGGVGGTTNLFNAVDNTPPAGTATETDSTQIESVDSTGDNATDEYRGDCGSYITNIGPSSFRVNALQVWCNHGEDVSTNTKTGSFGLQANPAVAYTTFTFGNDGGALGTYPTAWIWSKTSIQQAPAITPGSSLILAVRKTDSGTRVASVDFLGAYVDFTVEPPEFVMPRYRYW